MNFSSNAVPLVPTSGDMSQSQVFAGPIDVRFRRFIAISATYTGSPVGSLQLLGTTQIPAPGTPPNSGWQVMGNAVSLPNSTLGYLWDVIDTGCLYLAVLYTKTSGTGTLTVSQSTKD